MKNKVLSLLVFAFCNNLISMDLASKKENKYRLLFLLEDGKKTGKMHTRRIESFPLKKNRFGLLECDTHKNLTYGKDPSGNWRCILDYEKDFNGNQIPVASRYIFISKDLSGQYVMKSTFDPYGAAKDFIYNSTYYIQKMCSNRLCIHVDCDGKKEYKKVLKELASAIDLNSSLMRDTDNGKEITTPLSYFLLHKNDKDIACFLINLGLSPNVLNCHDETVLNQMIRFLVEAESCDYKKASCYIENMTTLLGVNSNIPNKVGNTPLHAVLFHPKDQMAFIIANYLLENGAEINKKNAEGFTPLHIACQFNNQQTALLLLSRGAQINAKTNKGKNVLHMACGAEIEQKGSARNFIQDLLKTEGVPINDSDYKGNTALHLVCSYQRDDLASLLIEYGADPEKKNDAGLVPACFFKR